MDGEERGSSWMGDGGGRQRPGRKPPPHLSRGSTVNAAAVSVPGLLKPLSSSSSSAGGLLDTAGEATDGIHPGLLFTFATSAFCVGTGDCCPAPVDGYAIAVTRVFTRDVNSPNASNGVIC